MYGWPYNSAGESQALPAPVLPANFYGVSTQSTPNPVFTDNSPYGLWASNFCKYLAAGDQASSNLPNLTFPVPALCPRNGGQCPGGAQACTPKVLSGLYQSVSVSANTRQAKENAGVPYTASALLGESGSSDITPIAEENLRNCAASSSVADPSRPLMVYWAEINPIDYRFAVQRSEYGPSSSLYLNPTGIWGNFYDSRDIADRDANPQNPDAIDAFTGLMDVAVTGVQLDPNPTENGAP